MENIFVEFLPPWVETGIQPAFYDKESGTVLQQTARMYARVNMLIRMFNKLSKQTKEEVERFEGTVTDEIERFEGVVNDTVEEYIEKFDDLHDYVEDYFDNLDVQQEINNKLDAMASNGDLLDLMKPYLQTQAVMTYDTVADMLASTDVADGTTVQTLGYYSANDGGDSKYLIVDDDNLVADGYFVLELTNGLKAQTIVEDDTLNLKQFGLKGDNSTDNLAGLQALMDSNYNTILVPKGQFRFSGTLTIPEGKNIYGLYNDSILVINTDGKIKCGVYDSITNSILFENLVVRCNGTRSDYAIDFENCNICKFTNCLIRSDNGDSKYNGIRFRRSNSALYCYDNRLINNHFQRTAVTFVNSTDNFIMDNIMWGRNLVGTAALQLEGSCSNTVISGNHIVPGSLGGIRIQDGNSQLRIVDNYFDGGEIAIYAEDLMLCNIDGNIMFHNEKAMTFEKIVMSTISNNTFKDCDHEDHGYDDILVTTQQGGNTFCGNKHFHTSTVTHTNLGKPYNLVAADNAYPYTVVNMASAAFSHLYTPINTTADNRTKYVNCYTGTIFATS